MTSAAQADAGTLILNWRDIGHPQAGGAEAYCWELASRLARRGEKVTLFTARHRGAARREVRDGVSIVRGGGRFGVYVRAAIHMLRHRRSYSAVVDCQNGIPFFSPLFMGPRCAIVCVIHHVHQQQFGIHFPPVAAAVGRILEKQVARAVYRRRPIVAVSVSTRRDVRLELGLRGPIHIVANGLTPLNATDVPRSVTPRIAVIGRLVPQKRLELLVDAAPALLARWPSLVIDIAGDGPHAQHLAERIHALGLDSAIRLHGRVSEQRKAALLSAAWLTVIPSVAEGWGLGVIEANSVGTPALGFDVRGLRDSIRPGATGWLIADGDSLSDGIAAALAELGDADVARGYRDRCQAWAASFDWDTSAERLADVLAVERSQQRRPVWTQRRVSDLAVYVEGTTLDNGPASRRLARGVRRTDTASIDGDQVQLILDGCDEQQAISVMSRLGLAPSEARMVTPDELAIRVVDATGPSNV